MGRGHVTLSTDNGQLQRGLAAAQSHLQGFARQTLAISAGITAAGAAVIAPFAGGLKHYLDAGDAMAKLSDRTGLAVEELSEFVHAVRQSGASAEDLEKASKAMSEFIVNASRGAPAALTTLEALGLSFDQLNRMSRAQQIEAFGEAISRVEDPALRTALAADVFSRSGMALMPMLRGGRAGIQALREEARRLGLTMSTEDARAAESFGDQLANLLSIGKMVTFHFGASIVPVLKNLVGFFIGAAASVNKFIADNRVLLQVIFGVGVMTVAVGVSVGVLAGLIYAAAFAVGFLGSTISIVTGAVSFLLGWLRFAATGFGVLRFVANSLSSVLTGLMFVMNGLHAVGMASMTAATAAYTFITGLATGATGGFTLALIAAWVWENLVTAGAWLLVTALGALIVAAGLVALAFGGWAIFAVVAAGLSLVSDQARATGSAIVNAFRSTFAWLVPQAQQTFGAIRDALSAGDFSRVWEIVATSAELAWVRILGTGSKLWVDLKFGAIGIFRTLTDWISDAFGDIWFGIKETFLSMWTSVQFTILLGISRVASSLASVLSAAEPPAVRIARELARAAGVSVPLAPAELLTQLADATGERARNTINAEAERARQAAFQREMIDRPAQDAARAARDLESARLRDQQRAAAGAGNVGEVARLQRALDSLEIEAWFAARVAEVGREMVLPEPSDEGLTPTGIKSSVAGAFAFGEALGMLGARGESAEQRQERILRDIANANQAQQDRQHREQIDAINQQREQLRRDLQELQRVAGGRFA